MTKRFLKIQTPVTYTSADGSEGDRSFKNLLTEQKKSDIITLVPLTTPDCRRRQSGTKARQLMAASTTNKFTNL